MQGKLRWIALAAGVGTLVALFLVLQPGDDPSPVPIRTPTVTPTPTVTSTPSASGSPTPSETTTSLASPRGDDATQIEVEVEEGRVEGPGSVSVALGSQVELRVESDLADEVHVHGYDLFAEVGPGRPARIGFQADVPGIFEVELEGSGALLLRLEVTS